MYKPIQRGVLALAAIAAAASCVSDAPTIPPPPAGGGASAPAGAATGTARALAPTLVECDPLPYAAAAQTFDAAGGELQVGPHRLTIPRGALTAPTVISAEAPESRNVVVRFSPDGQQFAVPVTLTLSYRHCRHPLALVERIVQVDDLLGVLESLPSADSPDGEVSARLRHFSGYAIAW